MPKRDTAAKTTSPGAALAQDLVDQIAGILQEAEEGGQPIELDPHRARLFELFVMAEATGFLEEGAAEDLSCDGIARAIATRWNLAKSMGGGLSQSTNLPPDQLRRLRLIWSFMRMWMEWTYAWRRWEEFHSQPTVEKIRVRK